MDWTGLSQKVQKIYCSHNINLFNCHTLHGCVDWNSTSANIWKRIRGHTLHGCVDWNAGFQTVTYKKPGHTLHGCVDWNDSVSYNVGLQKSPVTPFTGVWIETIVLDSIPYLVPVTPFTGVWIETMDDNEILERLIGHTLHGCVDWNCCVHISMI